MYIYVHLRINLFSNNVQLQIMATTKVAYRVLIIVPAFLLHQIAGDGEGASIILNAF